MKIFIQFWAATITFFVFLFILFPCSIIAATISKDTKTRLRITSWAWILFGHAIIRIGCLARLRFHDHRSLHLQTTIHQALYISNHLSLMDIPLILCAITIPPIMKKEIMRVPLFGITATVAGAIPVDRKDPNSRANVLKATQNRLLNSFPVQYYPEGTRSLNSKPAEFSTIKTKLMEFAYDNQIPVVAICLYGTDKMISRNGMVKPFQPVAMEIFKEIHPKDFSSKEEFMKCAWEKITIKYQEYENEFKLHS